MIGSNHLDFLLYSGGGGTDHWDTCASFIEVGGVWGRLYISNLALW